MDLRDRVAEARDTAATTASGARETVSEKADEARGRASDATGTASTVVSTATQAVSGRADDARGRITARLPDRLVDGSVVRERVGNGPSVHRLTSVSYERFALPDVRVRPALERGGDRAATVAREADFRRVFRFGKDGFAYGKTVGDYVPVVGSYLPYLGFATGIGVGVLDDIDVLTADAVAELSASLSEALEQVVRSDGGDPPERPVTDAAADPTFEEPGSGGPQELLEMDYEEFAGKR
ncbi:hypothetical protein [Halococcus sp. IIIV-5B]|uniref:hypothetical protein n=1 Tax=Halococcus sp. IIIV-5B TaxID=2321230 RepID=UPI000E76899E|nr:hypothetical protein [Halococcus sp. IIIV-5B]RJT05336.1 hypothetical protein D3261_08125 [Halococcus sp. IIIV-5B]